MEIWATDWHFEGKHPSTSLLPRTLPAWKADDKGSSYMCKEWYNKAVTWQAATQKSC